MNLKAWLAEFVGTFGFVFIGVGSVVAGYATGAADVVSPALAHGLALAVMISATAAVSGGHINPAVTVAAWVTNKIKAIDAIGYIIAQLAGGFVALKAMDAVFPSTGVDEGAAGSVNYALPQLGLNVDYSQAFAVEAIGCFFLTLAVFGTAMDKRAPRMGGFYVGAVVTAMALAMGFVSGGSFNPARYFGPAVQTQMMENWGVYILGPVLGAIIAGLLYQYVFTSKEDQTAAG